MVETGNETVSEEYEGVKVWWTSASERTKDGIGAKDDDKYVLKMLKKDKDFVKLHYMDYVECSGTFSIVWIP